MSISDPRRDGDEDFDRFIEAKNADYEPAASIHDEDDLPVDTDDLDDEAPVPDDERRVTIDDDEV